MEAAGGERSGKGKGSRYLNKAGRRGSGQAVSELAAVVVTDTESSPCARQHAGVGATDRQVAEGASTTLQSGRPVAIDERAVAELAYDV